MRDGDPEWRIVWEHSFESRKRDGLQHGRGCSVWDKKEGANHFIGQFSKGYLPPL
jgi:hypothetical protein